MKKLLPVILALTMVIMLPVQAFAMTVDENAILQSIADETIYKIADVTNTPETVTYRNIDKFVDEVRAKLPSIEDAELADFLVEYTEQDKTAVTDEVALTYLDAKEIVISDRFIKMDENGNETELSRQEIVAEIDREMMPFIANKYKSENGYLQLKIVVARQSDVGDVYVDYRVGAYATWLKMPKCHQTDTLIIDFDHQNAVFDSTKPVYGKLEETITCHGVESHYKSQVWKTDDAPDYFTNKNVMVDNGYWGGAIQFKLMPARKVKCDCGSFFHKKKLTSIQAFVSCGIAVKAGDDFTVWAAYGHTRPIGITFDNNSYYDFPANVDTYISWQTTLTAYGDWVEELQ